MYIPLYMYFVIDKQRGGDLERARSHARTTEGICFRAIALAPLLRIFGLCLEHWKAATAHTFINRFVARANSALAGFAQNRFFRGGAANPQLASPRAVLRETLVGGPGMAPEPIKCTLQTFGTFSTPTFGGVGEPYNDKANRTSFLKKNN